MKVLLTGRTVNLMVLASEIEREIRLTFAFLSDSDYVHT